MQVTINDKQHNRTRVVDCRYPFTLSIILLIASLILGFVFLGLGLNEVNGVDFTGKSTYASINFIIMNIAFMVAFDLIVQISSVLASLQKPGATALLILPNLTITIIFFIVYCSGLHVSDFTVILWVPICFVLALAISYFKMFSTVIKSDKMYYERTALFVILNVVFDIVLYGLMLIIMAYFIWFIIIYVILCVIFRREPIGMIVIIIVR